MKSILKNVLNIGNLYLEKVLNKFEDENIVFICRDDNYNKYFCLCYEFRSSLKWIITKISSEMLWKLITHKTDIRSIFQENEELIHIIYKNNNEATAITSFSDLEEKILPKAGINLK